MPFPGNNNGQRFAVDHSLFFADPGKEGGTLLLCGRCLDRKGADPLEIEIRCSREKRLPILADIPRDCEGETRPCGFYALIPFDQRPSPDEGVGLILPGCDEEKVGMVDIEDLLSRTIDDLGLSEIKKVKLNNLLLNERERIHHVKGIRSLPIYLRINPCWECNLDCPSCRSNLLRKAGYLPKGMSQDTFQKIMDRYGDSLIQVLITDEGEPFLNPRTPGFIRAMKEREIHVTAGSHCNLDLSDKEVDDIVGSGLDELKATIDGITQETYEKYRRGGSLALALDTAGKLISRKKALGLESPRMVWRFLVFDWNGHEIEGARALAGEMGFDAFETAEGERFEDYAPSVEFRDNSFMDSMEPGIRESLIRFGEEKRRRYRYHGCDLLYHQIVIHTNGMIHPCRHAHELRHLYGTIHSPRDIFNSALYKNGRRLFIAPPPEECQGYNPCLNCWIVTDARYGGYVPSDLDFFQAYERLTGRPLEM